MVFATFCATYTGNNHGRHSPWGPSFATRQQQCHIQNFNVKLVTCASALQLRDWACYFREGVGRPGAGELRCLDSFAALRLPVSRFHASWLPSLLEPPSDHFGRWKLCIENADGLSIENADGLWIEKCRWTFDPGIPSRSRFSICPRKSHRLATDRCELHIRSPQNLV